jgi:carboxyl-terminal processing protease
MAREYDFDFGLEKKQVSLGNSSYSLIVLVAFFVLVAVSAFLVGVMFERRTNAANDPELATFWEVWDIIEQDFFGEMPSAQERKFGAINGLIASLNDPFTSFAPPELAAARREQIDGHFGGVGIVVRANDSFQVEVLSIIPGNPAEEAGIIAGDIFVGVDDQPLDGMTTDQVADLVKGEVGTNVKLTMFRPDTGETLDFIIRRAIIETPTVFSENMDGIGYVRLSTFNGVATSQMEDHLQSLLDEGVEAFVLDLRANGGGLLDESVSIADLFLDEGIVLTQRSSDGSEEVFRSDNGDLAEDLPLIVLVDGGTASAAEVVAGALQDRDRALLVGSETFGKGVVQLVYDLVDGSQLRVTSSAWFTPEDHAIHNAGLSPDLEVELAFDISGDDLILQEALDYLNEEVLSDD